GLEWELGGSREHGNQPDDPARCGQCDWLHIQEQTPRKPAHRRPMSRNSTPAVRRWALSKYVIPLNSLDIGCAVSIMHQSRILVWMSSCLGHPRGAGRGCL